MNVDFTKVDTKSPQIILKNTKGSVVGVIPYVKGLTPDIKYNETSSLSFSVPAFKDGEVTPFYDKITGMRVIELEDIGQFMLVNPKEIGDGIKKYKECKAYSLEYEFTFKKITLEKGTYNFWNPVTPKSTVLGIILDLMPSWGAGEIDPALVGKYRTYEVAEENLYNFIKGTLQNSYQCIFDFDTFNRLINVKAVASEVTTKPVFISHDNLAKEITVEEQTEDIITRLDVNGAEGVSIRDVNPTGTNQVINLDYFMTTDNFDRSLIDKYNSWKALYSSNQLPYYNLSVEYSLQVMKKVAEQGALTELQGEMSVLENEQAITIQSIAQGLKGQADLTDVNRRIASKEKEIDNQKTVIKNIEAEAENIYSQLQEINKATNFKNAFTEEEYILLDKFIIDEAVSESSFVYSTAESFEDEPANHGISNKTLTISETELTFIQGYKEKDIYSFKSGKLNISDLLSSDIISAAFERSSDSTFTFTAYLGSGSIGERLFETACISVSGSVSALMSDTSYFTTNITSANLYFTLNTTEYERRAVAWELFEYGEEVLSKMAYPSYRFNITAANFLDVDDFITFKNSISLGEKIYIQIDEDKTLRPIFVGISWSYDSIKDLTLEFSDTYISGDSSFKLADLLEKSISMGKNVDLSKFTYSAFVDSGADTRVKTFIESALDVSKNAIMSSSDQAIYWGDAGIRLRKWANNAKTAYEDEQIWMNNNSILMTDNNWATASLAIGKFKDPNLGNCWGIVAPNIVGTLLAGQNLVIESEKKDGGVAVFKVDGEGCMLYNSTFNIVNDKKHITLNPETGIVIGAYPVLSEDGSVNTDNASFYADDDGNLVLKGTVYAQNGEFKGDIQATSGYIGNEISGWSIGASCIYNGKDMLLSETQGTYIGTDGISLGGASNYIQMTPDGTLSANNVSLKGGSIGDFLINANGMYYNSGSQNITISSGGIFIGDSLTGYTCGLSSDGTFTANKANIKGTITATDGTFNGTIYATNGEFTGTVKAGSVLGGTLSLGDSGMSINPNTKEVDIGDGGTFIYLKPNEDKGGKIHIAAELSHDLVNTRMRSGISVSGILTTSAFAGCPDNFLELYSQYGLLSGTWASQNDIFIISDRNLKNTIELIDEKYSIMFDNLKARTFKYNHGSSDRLHIGYIAQEVKEAMTIAGIDNIDFAGLGIQQGEESETYLLRYGEFIALNTHEIQKLKARIKELEAKLQSI